MFACCCYFIFVHRFCDLFREGGGGGGVAVVSTPPLLFPKWWHPAQCWPLNFVGLSFVRVTLGFKDWRAESDTRESFECAYTHTHTDAIDGFGMHSQRVNRVTSSASCSVLKLSTPEPCATYQDIYMILGVLCQRPLLALKPWHLFALPVAMKMAWRWFSGEVKEGTATGTRVGGVMNRWWLHTVARITKLSCIEHALDIRKENLSNVKSKADFCKLLSSAPNIFFSFSHSSFSLV